jgi:hypothetical protein
MFAQQTRDFGAASFVAPPGWAADSRPNMQTFTRVSGQNRCMLLVSAEEPMRGTLDASFGAVWSAAFTPNVYRNADRPASVEQVSPAGYRHAVGESELEDRTGNRFIVRLHVFPIGQRVQSVVLIGSSRSALEECRNDWGVFFASLRFRGIPADARAAAGANASPPVSTPSPATPPVLAPPTRPNAVTDRTPQRFDNVTFVPPLGWSVQRASGVVDLSPTDMTRDESLHILLLPGRPSPGGLPRDLNGDWEDVRARIGAELLMTVNGVHYEAQQPTRSLRGIEYVKANGGMRRRDGNYNVDVYLFRAGDRVERAAVVSRDFRNNTVMVTTSSNGRYWRPIRELLFTMTFANQPDRRLAPAGLRPGGIVGVWAGLSMNMGSIRTNFAVFFDNGLAYFGPKFPSQGLLDIDPAVEQPAYQRDWGSYTFTGGTGVLTMPYGTIPLRDLGSALELTTNRTAHRFVRFPLPEGPLDGTWCMAGGQCLRLTSAGRFEDAGAVRALEHSTYAFPSTPAGGQGRYTLRSHTLVLTYDSGAEVRVGFVGLMPNDRAPSPAQLWLGFEADKLVRR